MCKTTLASGKYCSLRENSAVLYLRNNHAEETVIYHTDSDDFMTLEQRNGKKISDYLLLHPENKTWIIELKETLKEHACDQIRSTVEVIEENKQYSELVNNKDMLLAYIVTPNAHVPDLNHRKHAGEKLYRKSKVKLRKPTDHVVFVRCISKLVGKPSNRNDGIILNSNKLPLSIE